MPLLFEIFSIDGTPQSAHKPLEFEKSPSRFVTPDHSDSGVKTLYALNSI